MGSTVLIPLFSETAVESDVLGTMVGGVCMLCVKNGQGQNTTLNAQSTHESLSMLTITHVSHGSIPLVLALNSGY